VTSTDTTATDIGGGATPPPLPFACDLVMKGGITSGVVYPPAIVELARDHRFHNIGGASAGAIAAVAAAGAEYGRQTGGGGGFDALARIPDDLAATDSATGHTGLQRLFVPQPETREYFDLIWQQRAMKGASTVKRVRSLLPVAFRHSSAVPSPALSLIAFGLPIGALVWLILDPSPGTIGFMVIAALVGIVAYVIGRVASGVQNLATDAPKKLAANMHGLCNGATVGDQTGLTDWLHERIEEMAGPVRDGKSPGKPRPLTYGDLAQRDIGLVTLTTNLSQSSSENFPFTDETWAFKQTDIETLFPEPVAKYLVQRGKEATDKSSKRYQLRAQDLLKFPPPAELPVLLGARISLSFPVLLSAVPLWRLAPVRQKDGDWVTDYHEVWLSDGGICSNLPVHLFDSPLPSRPTYGINLASGTTGPVPTSGDEATNMAYAHENVWRPIGTGSGASSPISEIGSTLGLLGEVLNTMQNWSDNSMTRALGVRDRICTVRLDAGEGGMNLDMSRTTISGLTPRGRAAGENLGWMVRGDRPKHATGDDDEAAAQWTRHRWTRLRSNVLGAGRYLADMANGRTKAAVPQAGNRLGNTLTYDQLATSAHDLEFLPYRSDWDDNAATALLEGIDALNAIDFRTANTKSPPPFRELTLTTRAEPETDIDK
jgi:Patatin-like phospholipase